MAADPKLLTQGSPSEVTPRTSTQVRADIERARAQIAESMSALRDEVAHRTDWRQWVRQRPGLCLGAAFAVGFWLAYRDDRR